MSRNFQSWEKDPFFSAAEQVQDSADRLESAFRAWIHTKSLIEDKGSLDICRRELSTALGIAKWQLEEFEREVSALAQEPHGEDDAPQRHQQFVEAVSNQLSSIRRALLSSKDDRDLKVLSTITLDREESDDLAHFLCGSRTSAADSAVDTSSSSTKADGSYKDLTTSVSLFSTSSGVDCCKALSGSLDECSSYQDTGISREISERNLPSEAFIVKGNPAYMPEVHINAESIEIAPRAAPGLLHRDCYDTVIERASGHQRSASVGGILSCCTERASGHNRTMSVSTGLNDCNEATVGRTIHKHATSSLVSNIWPSFLRTGLFVGTGVSQSVLKRLKDGEGDPLDMCELCDGGDIEARCSNFLCHDGKGSEVLQTLQSWPKMVLTRQLVQKIAVIFAALGLLGLYLY